MRNRDYKKHYKLYNDKHLVYLKQNPWLTHGYDAKKRCVNKKNSHYMYYGGRGIKYLLTSEQVKFLWFRDKAYEMKRPSIDRIDNDGNYELNNCRFIEFLENIGKAKRKQVIQKTIFGVKCRIWPSIKAIREELGYDISTISEAIKHNKISHGFRWRFLND